MSTQTDTPSINARIAELGTLIKSLKASSSPFDAELKEMLALKSQLAPASSSSGPKLQLKTPKGTKDHGPAATLLRQGIFDSLSAIFKKHGGMTIDTPVFELRDILAGK
jgi:histidyl-tRNA synthetase